MAELLEVIEKLSRATQKTEAEVMAQAFEAGLRQLWREHILGQYLRGEISREEAIKAVGMYLVELAENQREAMLEDLEWALEK